MSQPEFDNLATPRASISRVVSRQSTRQDCRESTPEDCRESTPEDTELNSRLKKHKMPARAFKAHPANGAVAVLME